MAITDKKVAILVSDLFEEVEFEDPFKALKDAGVAVTVVSAAGRELQSLHHAEKGRSFTADVLLNDVHANDYDALVLPGGAMNADHLRMVQNARNWVQDFMEKGKPLAVICHAPWVLVSADVVNGRKLTSYYTIQDDIRNAGGEWVDEAVVIDGSLITSRKPDDLPAFNKAVLDMLTEAG